MIALIGNRPVLQVGRYQVSCYDSQWLRDALCKAMHAADRDDFPFVDEICQGIFHYLENKCPLRLLPLPSLYQKMQRMLERIGCENIARELRPLAPPVQVSLLKLVKDSGCDMEMMFFPMLRREIEELCQAGAYEIRFLHVRECVMQIRSTSNWDKACQTLANDIRAFLMGYDPRLNTTQSALASLVLHLQDATHGE